MLGVVQCEFSVPADVWMRSDLFRLKMVHLCLTPIVNYSRNSLAGLKMFSKLKLKFPDQGFLFFFTGTCFVTRIVKCIHDSILPT